MIDHESLTEGTLRHEENIARILDRASRLFKKTGLPELATKWDKILNNYAKPKGLR